MTKHLNRRPIPKPLLIAIACGGVFLTTLLFLSTTARQSAGLSGRTDDIDLANLNLEADLEQPSALRSSRARVGRSAAEGGDPTPAVEPSYDAAPANTPGPS